MWILVALSACVPVDSDGSDTSGSSTTTPPPTTPTQTTWPFVGLTLTVEPLVLGQPTAITVDGAPPGATNLVWRGDFGGTTCPPELAGACVPIGSAVIVADGLSDAAGTAALTW